MGKKRRDAGKQIQKLALEMEGLTVVELVVPCSEGEQLRQRARQSADNALGESTQAHVQCLRTDGQRPGREGETLPAPEGADGSGQRACSSGAPQPRRSARTLHVSKSDPAGAHRDPASSVLTREASVGRKKGGSGWRVHTHEAERVQLRRAQRDGLVDADGELSQTGQRDLGAQNQAVRGTRHAVAGAVGCIDGHQASWGEVQLLQEWAVHLLGF